MAVSQTSGQANVYSVPSEVQSIIFGYLDSQSIEVVRRVCVMWRDIIQNPNFRSIKADELNGEYFAKLQELVDCFCLLPPHLARIDFTKSLSRWRFTLCIGDDDKMVKCDTKLHEFYEAFKERAIFQHHYIDSREFMNSAKTIKQELINVAAETTTKDTTNQCECCYQDIYFRACQDLIRAFASHFTIVRCSQNVFNQKIANLQLYCNFKTDVIKSFFTWDIGQERHEYRYQLKSTIEGLKKEHALLETRLIDLRGTNGFNGAIDLAFKNGDINKYNQLNSELQVLAQFDNNGSIIGGTFFKLSEQINKLKSEYDAFAAFADEKEYKSY